jgi:hypothetical protein
MNRLAPLLAFLAAALPFAATADQRSYGFTYQAVTAPKGALDLELWSTLYDPPGASGQRAWVHQVELEYGLTDRWDVALYNVFRRDHGDDLRYEAIKVESRYRVTEPGASLVDVVAYLEVEQSVLGERPTAFEEKLILAKDVGRANLALNLIAEQELEAGKTELEWGWSAGASWEFHPRFRLGAETFGDLKEAETAAGDALVVEAWAGPAVSVSLPVQAGALHGSWFSLAAGFGLNDHSDDLRLRGVLAFQF